MFVMCQVYTLFMYRDTHMLAEYWVGNGRKEKEGTGSIYKARSHTSSPTKQPSPGMASVNRVADVIGEMVLIDQGAAKANAIKRQENIQR